MNHKRLKPKKRHSLYGPDHHRLAVNPRRMARLDLGIDGQLPELFNPLDLADPSAVALLGLPSKQRVIC